MTKVVTKNSLNIIFDELTLRISLMTGSEKNIIKGAKKEQ